VVGVAGGAVVDLGLDTETGASVEGTGADVEGAGVGPPRGIGADRGEGTGSTLGLEAEGGAVPSDMAGPRVAGGEAIVAVKRIAAEADPIEAMAVAAASVGRATAADQIRDQADRRPPGVVGAEGAERGATAPRKRAAVWGIRMASQAARSAGAAKSRRVREERSSSTCWATSPASTTSPTSA
jgi:hypothetical protein